MQTQARVLQKLILTESQCLALEQHTTVKAPVYAYEPLCSVQVSFQVPHRYFVAQKLLTIFFIYQNALSLYTNLGLRVWGLGFRTYGLGMRD